jgi:hypothetical protein
MTLWRQSRLFIYYCLPGLIAVSLVLFTNFYRVSREVAPLVVANACQDLKSPTVSNPVSNAPLTKRQQIVEAVKAKGWSNCDDASQREMQKSFRNAWFSNGLFISTLSLLPFGILGLGLARRYRKEFSSDLEKKEGYTSYRRIANRDFIMKYLVGLIIAFGWLYIFNPNGQAATAINNWLLTNNVIANDTAPLFFNLKDSSIKHAIVAVLGWYLYLLGYFVYRFYNSDVLSTRIYNVLFKKFLFVIGVALIFSGLGAGSTESMILVFLVGMFPLSAVTLLTEFGNKRLSMGEDQTSLTTIPGISTWQVMRLEEEGIDSLSALAEADYQELSKSISSKVIKPAKLRDWIDQARLITVLGPKRWAELNGICERATVFVQEKDTAEFKAKLATKNLMNPDEIAKTLEATFADLKP